MANKKITKQQIELELKNQALNQSHEEIKEQNVKIEEHRYEVEEKSKEILDSINYAKRIQKAILPPANFMNQYYPDNFVLYLPKDIVAGDFYWMEAVAESNKIFISAADCTGHGVPGAMVSVLCSNALTQATLDHHIEDPGKILDKTVDLLLERFSKAEEDVKDGMDLALVSIDTETNVLQYSGAHNPLWIIRKGSDQIDVIKADKQPVGMFEDRKPFTTHEIQLEKGDTFYIFSDGFADQFGGSKGKKFKYKPFRELLLKHKADRLVIQKTAIHTAFLDWKRDLEQVDDICVIGIRV